MDLLVISNILNNFSKIIFNKNNSKQEIDFLTEFLDDPFNLDFNHLNYFYLQVGGAETTTEPPAAAPPAAAPTTEPPAAAPPAAAPPAAAPTTEPPAAGGPPPDPNALATAAAANPEAVAAAAANPEAAAAAAGAEIDPAEAGKMAGNPGKMRDFLAKVAGNPNDEDDPESNKLLDILNFIVKCLLYPLLFIFLMIYPYLYVTRTSFKKLIKSYRNNVRVM